MSVVSDVEHDAQVRHPIQ